MNNLNLLFPYFILLDSFCLDRIEILDYFVSTLVGSNIYKQEISNWVNKNYFVLKYKRCYIKISCQRHVLSGRRLVSLHLISFLFLTLFFIFLLNYGIFNKIVNKRYTLQRIKQSYIVRERRRCQRASIRLCLCSSRYISETQTSAQAIAVTAYLHHSIVSTYLYTHTVQIVFIKFCLLFVLFVIIYL